MWWPWRKPSWTEATLHDVGILPGGQVIHYTTCWCRKAERERAGIA